MKKFICLVLLNLLIANLTFAFVPAVLAGNRASRRNRVRRIHERNYHEGNLVSTTTYEHCYKKTENELIVQTYENTVYYYEKDPRQCIQHSDRKLVEEKLANQQQRESYQSHQTAIVITLIFCGILFICVLVGIILIEKFFPDNEVLYV